MVSMSIKVQPSTAMSREPALRLIKQKIKKNFGGPMGADGESREEVLLKEENFECVPTLVRHLLTDTHAKVRLIVHFLLHLIDQYRSLVEVLLKQIAMR